MTISYPIILKGAKYIYCGKHVFLGPNGILTAWPRFNEKLYNPNITIGDYVITIGNGFHISAVNKIFIGNNVLMGKYVTIVDNAHGKVTFSNMCLPPIKRDLDIGCPVIIEDNVWIADKVTITKGVRIGKGSIIGANSVVTKDIPPYSLAVGIPAKIIKQFKY